MSAVPPTLPADAVVLHFEVRIKSDRLEEFRGHVATMTDSSKTEPGCLFYRYHTADDDPAHFILWEAWADRGALITHLRRLVELFGPPAPGSNPPIPAALSNCFADLRVHELTPV